MENKYHLDFNYREKERPFGSTTLVQLGRRHFSRGASVGEHAHAEFYEITVVTDGTGTISTNGVATPVKKGDCYFSLPGDFHDLASSKDAPLQYDYLAFKTAHPVLKEEFSNLLSAGLPPSRRLFLSPRVEEGVARAISELSDESPFYETVLSLVFEQTLFECVRALRPISVHKKKRQSKAETLCYQIMYYIDTHIYSLEKLSDLSAVFSYHYSYLSALFKKTTGDSLQRYFQTRKLETAKLLLKEGTLKIVEISLLLQYSSLYAFSKAFKNAYGVSPKAFKG